MEQFGDGHRPVRIKEVVQVVHIVAVVEELEDDEFVSRELILSSNRRPIPIPYTEEP